MKPELEICCYSAEAVEAAARGGADRVELCAGPAEGGITPSCACIEAARKVPGIELFVIVRPRGGDFCYSSAEFNCMKRDIEIISELGVDGVVIGILKPDGHVDTERVRELVELADFTAVMGASFHRAFDMSADPVRALEDIHACGIRRVLSSGTRNTVDQGLDVLAELVRKAGDRMALMAGSGVNYANLDALYDIGIRQFHSTASKILPSVMQYRNPHIQMGKGAAIDEYAISQVDETLVRNMRQRLDELHRLAGSGL